MQDKSSKAKQTLEQTAKLFGGGGFAKHLAAGTASGWLTGTVVRHTGRGIAFVAGSGVILYQIAHHNGYIKQDWDSIKQLAQKKTDQLTKNTPAIGKMKTFATKNRVFTAGFVGGFLLGIAF